MTDPARPWEPPIAGSETEHLVGALDRLRTTFRWKADGLDAAGLRARIGVSALTLGGLLKHMALVEDNWFSIVLMGNEDAEYWRGIDWEGDPDWEFRTAADDSPEELFRLFDDAVAASDRILDEVGDDPDRRSARSSRHSEDTFDLRWILVHMIEEYARHNGHADLIRESIDGSTGA